MRYGHKIVPPVTNMASTYRVLSDLMCEEGLLEGAFQYTLNSLAIAQNEASTTP